MNRRRSSRRSPSAVAAAEDLHQAFSRELARARRNGKSVSVLVAATDGRHEDAHLEELRLHLRRYDVLGVVDGAVVILAPEVDRSGAEVLRTRLDELGAVRWASGLGLAVAPEDGDSLVAIVHAARQPSHAPEGVLP